MSASKKIMVRIGTDKVPVAIDGSTTAEELRRILGRGNYVLTINGNTVGNKDKIAPLLTGDDDIRLTPRAPVG
jgi:hypothetical protein